MNGLGEKRKNRFLNQHLKKDPKLKTGDLSSYIRREYSNFSRDWLFTFSTNQRSEEREGKMYFVPDEQVVIFCTSGLSRIIS